MILYFSGTGNSAYLAKRIAEATGDALCSINDCLKRGEAFSDNTQTRLIFVLPTYAWRIPRVVEEWILTSAFARNAEAYFVMNCGDSIGNAAKYVKKLCEKKGFRCRGCAEIVMPENYIAMFSAPDSENARKIVDKARPKLEDVIARILKDQPLAEERTTFLGALLSGPVNKLFYSFAVHDRKFRVDEKCIGCGKCEKTCPLNNITLKEKRPSWHRHCTHCMACITVCPTGAIEYGKKSVGQPRYRCPYEE